MATRAILEGYTSGSSPAVLELGLPFLEQKEQAVRLVLVVTGDRW